jgi:hypothetical protein
MSDVISLREEEVIKLSRRNRRKIWERESWKKVWSSSNCLHINIQCLCQSVEGKSAWIPRDCWMYSCILYIYTFWL